VSKAGQIQELVTLNHPIGKDILQRQTSESWGAKDIQRLHPDNEGVFRFKPEIHALFR
jgi:hypothetical protein